MLHDAQQRNRETQENQEPGEVRQIAAFAKGLRRQKKNHQVRGELQQFDSRQKRIGRGVQQQLRKPDREQSQQRPIQGIPVDPHAIIQKNERGPTDE